MDAAESQTTLDPQPLQDNPKQLITLGKGDQVPLEEIWREADPACRFCTRGIQTVEGGPRRVCGCAVRNIMRRRHGQTPHAPLAKVVKSPAGEEHARAKLDRLRREADKQCAEIERRQLGYDAGVDEAMAAVAKEEAKLQEVEGRLGWIALDMDALQAEWNEEVERYKEKERLHWEAVNTKTTEGTCVNNEYVEQQQACVTAKKALDAVKARAQRRLDDMAGARARLEKLERRIAIHRAAHPELEGEVKS